MKRNLFLTIFFILLGGSVVTRIVQEYFTIDPSTGFTYEKFSTLMAVLTVLLILVSVGIVLLGRFTVKLKDGYDPRSGSTWIAVGAGLMAITLITTGLSFFFENFQYLGTIKITYTLTYSLDIIMGLFFLYMCCLIFIKGKISMLVPIAAVIWSAARVIAFYITFNGITTNTENILNLMAYISGMMFWLFFARAISGYMTEESVAWSYGFGGLAAMYAAMMMIPRLVFTFMGRNDLLNNASGTSLIEISTLIFIILYVCKPARRSKQPKANESESTETEATATESVPTEATSLEKPGSSSSQIIDDWEIEEILKQ